MKSLFVYLSCHDAETYPSLQVRAAACYVNVNICFASSPRLGGGDRRGFDIGNIKSKLKQRRTPGGLVEKWVEGRSVVKRTKVWKGLDNAACLFVNTRIRAYELHKRVDLL